MNSKNNKPMYFDGSGTNQIKALSSDSSKQYVIKPQGIESSKLPKFPHFPLRNT
ncbi:hypothetical protein SAMN05192533_12335 [Mesobacillus persicus]|uniref:Uncharacterized protein n=1 Tax=Mesobacillus persicus TaxID=930146 RepID=A0A1H8JZX2_9BACI|nr:hypothetical protein [Mesobacillus persicus]SEN85718.1 hypothetical protein SAMN05192533_12335 [Mesobacillus persicus]